MTTEFTMPSLGADMDDGVIVEWRVAPGDAVERGQIVVVVETDKSEIEVEIFHDGIVEQLLVDEGERVAVGTPIARLGAVDQAPCEPAADAAVPPVPAAETAAPAAGAAVPAVETAAPPVPQGLTSPVVRHLAEELHIDLSMITGSGPGGRISRADVEAAAVRPTGGRRRITPRARRLAARAGIDPEAIGGADEVVTGTEVLADAGRSKSNALQPSTPDELPADPMRRAIAALMARSWAEIPHFHVGRRVVISQPLARLTAINEGLPVGERIIPAAVLLHAVARAAAQRPAVNGWWRSGGFEPAEHVDLGVVVALRGGGLVAPTIRAAETLSVVEIMQQLTDVVQRARRRALRSSDVTEASLSVTNLGDLGADYVNGVIHPPQVALVGFGAIHPEVVAIDGDVVIAETVHATLAGDHRALDGLLGAQFLTALAENIVTSVESI
jgi:pyruvate dehydrogenase E2 component (dihydrolipoamide acetyltransferase)